MKIKFIIPVIILLTLFSGMSTSFAKKGVKWRTYEIVKLTEDSITVKSKGGVELVINKPPKDYKVGDKVRYSKKRNRLKKYHPKRVY